MAKTSLAVLVALAVFLVGEISSFQLEPEVKLSSHRSRHLYAMIPSKSSFGDSLDDRGFCLGATTPFGESLFPSLSNSNSNSNLSELRRTFLTNLISNGAAASWIISSVSLPQRAVAGVVSDVVSTGAIKVTPIAHTFVTTGKSLSPKPIRENDATRFFTNARVVYIFEGNTNNDNARLAQDVTDLTKQRKAEKGPGVTPGNLRTLAPEQLMKASAKESNLSSIVVETAKQMPDGDVLLVGPIRSQGTKGDGKILANTASGLGTFVGGNKGQGVVSVVLNGPKENLKLIESGFPASELLWYSLPTKQ